jgi:hypothetical protein
VVKTKRLNNRARFPKLPSINPKSPLPAITPAFIVGSIGKRARLFKRLVLTTAGAGSAAAFCYPSEGEMFAKSAIEETNRLGLIAYNFVQGVQPKEITVKNVVDTNVLTEKVNINCKSLQILFCKRNYKNET